MYQRFIKILKRWMIFVNQVGLSNALVVNVMMTFFSFSFYTFLAGFLGQKPYIFFIRPSTVCRRSWRQTLKGISLSAKTIRHLQDVCHRFTRNHEEHSCLTKRTCKKLALVESGTVTHSHTSWLNVQFSTLIGKETVRRSNR